MIRVLAFLSLFSLWISNMSDAQQRTPQDSATTPQALRHLGVEYYRWRDESYPVGSSDQGLHTWDHRLTDYSSTAIRTRRQHVAQLLAKVRAMQTRAWKKDDLIDWLLFRAQLDNSEFYDRVLQF